jgi:hypothetical protein
MRSIFAGAIGLATIVLVLPVQGAYIDEKKSRALLDTFHRHSLMAENERYCMTLALYFEGGSTRESEDGQRHIARVITERAKENRRIWGGRTICGVVFHKVGVVCQFSFACLPRARRTPRKGTSWRASATIARKALAGENAGPSPLIRYYMNESLTPPRNACRFRQEFVPVVRAGRHEFFREATLAERRILAVTPSEACARHRALVESAKARALAKANANRKRASRKRTSSARYAAKRVKTILRRGKIARLRHYR